MLPTQVAEDVFGESCNKAVLMGPSFARELITKQPTQVVIAANSHMTAKRLQDLMRTSYFNVVISDDMFGVQMSAAYKNVIALGAGILHGAGYGENVRALLFTKGFCEMMELVNSIGGACETTLSIAGMGDLALTTYSTQSRNFMIGIRIGKGEKLSEILDNQDVAPEGITTIQALVTLQNEAGIELPIATAIYSIIVEISTVDTYIQILMNL